MNRSSIFPSWLHKALDLEQPEVPTVLDTSAVLPTIDPYQGGWGTMEWEMIQVNRLANQGAGVETIVNDSRHHTRLILALSVRHLGGAVNGKVLLSYYDPYTGTNQDAYLAEAEVAFGGGIHSHVELFGSMHPILIPPKARFRATFPATGAGETYVINAWTAEVAAGWKLL